MPHDLGRPLDRLAQTAVAVRARELLDERGDVGRVELAAGLALELRARQRRRSSGSNVR